MADVIFTQVTVAELANRDIDVLSTAPVIEVRTRHGEYPSSQLELALRSLHQQVEAGTRNKQLPIDQCIALCTIYDLVKWRMASDSPQVDLAVYFFSDPVDNNLYWKDHDTYHVLAMGTYQRLQNQLGVEVYEEWLAEDFDGLTREQIRRRKKMNLRRKLQTERCDCAVCLQMMVRIAENMAPTLT